MESASGSITLKKATRKDIKEITELIYITEPEPELEWGYGSEKERKQVLEHLMKIKNNRFSLKNFIVARKDNKLIGMALLIDGKDIDRLTINSEKKVVKIQKGFLNKLGYIYSSIRDYFLFRECEDDEFYISNIAIKKEFRGNGYAKVMIDKISKMAKRKGYDKVSLVAKNDKLIKFYESLGFNFNHIKLDENIKEGWFLKYKIWISMNLYIHAYFFV